MKNPRSLLLPVALALLAVSSVQAQTTLLSDTFADGNRTGLSLPGSTEWLANVPGNVSTDTSGITVSSLMTSGQSVGAQFVNGSAHNIGIGESLSLTFTFKVNSAVDSGSGGGFNNAFRIGLFNSNGAEPDNGTGINSAIWNPLTGYFAAVNLGYVSGSVAPIVLGERAAVGSGTSFVHLNHVVGGSAQPYYTQLGSNGGTNNTFDQTATTFYTAAFTLSRTDASTMNVSLSITGDGISGYSHSANDTTTPYTSFDVLVIGAATGGMSAFTIDSVTVSAIPEPSTYAAFAGLGALGLAFWQRRRKAA